MPEFFNYPPDIILIIAALAFATGALHGATGMAGGVVMAAILAHLIGIKEAVPVMTCALIFSHGSRVFIYWKDTDWEIVRLVLLFSVPTILLGAYLFTILSALVAAIVFAMFLAMSLPIKYWAAQRRIKTNPKLLAGASMVWGVLAGNVIGPGFFLAPFLLGAGMNRFAFAGTLAFVTLVMNGLKLVVFGVSSLMTPQLLIMGVFIGVITIPGNWLGSNILHKISDGDHRSVVDILTVGMVLNFIYLAYSYI